MTYSCRYKSNPAFPYNKTNSNTKKQKKASKADVSSPTDASFLASILSPIENILGRKIAFDDILLLALIYVVFTEKNKENNTLLLCLLFILLS